MTCKYCKKEFIPKTVSQKFCCIHCKDSYWNKKKPNRHRKGYYEEYNFMRNAYNETLLYEKGIQLYDRIDDAACFEQLNI